MLFRNKININIRVKRLLVTTASFCVSLILQAQNLIPFGHFEGDVEAVNKVWKQPNEQYFHFQFGANALISPRTGNACNGVCILGGVPTEYLQVALLNPLEANQAYQLSFYVRGYGMRLFNPERRDSIGVLFAYNEFDIKTRTNLFEQPQLKFWWNAEAGYTKWQKVELSYKALGGESHLILGNFEEVSAVDAERIEEIKEELSDLNDSYYETAKQNMSGNFAASVPGMKQSRKQQKAEARQVKAQMEAYDAYEQEKKLLENELINLYSGKSDRLEYQIRLYFDDFCFVKQGETCVELPVNDMSVETKSFKSNIHAGDTIVLNNVYFNNDESVLLAKSYSELNVLFDVLDNNPSMEISIEGHTDSNGDDAYNISLSKDRATAVKQYLIDLGIQEERLFSQGFGETRPVESNTTEEGRSKNRRVEVVILKP